MSKLTIEMLRARLAALLSTQRVTEEAVELLSRLDDAVIPAGATIEPVVSSSHVASMSLPFKVRVKTTISFRPVYRGESKSVLKTLYETPLKIGPMAPGESRRVVREKLRLLKDKRPKSKITKLSDRRRKKRPTRRK